MSEQKKLMMRVSSEFARFILAAVATVLAVPSASYADILSPVFIQLCANSSANSSNCVGGITSLGAGTLTDTQTTSYGTATITAAASYSGPGDNSVTVSGSSLAGPTAQLTPGVFSYGSAVVTYYYEIVQTPGTILPPVVGGVFTSVNLIFEANFLTEAFEGPAQVTYSEAAANLDTDEDGNVHLTTICAQAPLQPGIDCTTGYNSYSIDDVNPFAPSALGVAADITISVSGSAGLGGSWYASIDPTIEIDPSSPYAADFTIEGSLSPSVSTPEPAAPLLLGTGLLALLGSGMYRRLLRNPAAQGH